MHPEQSHNAPPVAAEFFPRPEQFNMQEFAHKLLAVGEEWANASAALELLEEGRKVLLAKLIQEHQASGFANGGKGLSRIAAEDRALTDARYKDYLVKLRDQRKSALTLRTRFDTSKMYVELIRSHLATQRAEMNIR